jgi:hypothetical protein
MSKSPARQRPVSRVPSRAPSPTKKDSNQDARKLEAYGILEVERSLGDAPAELGALVASFSKRKDTDAPPSAHKARVLNTAASARRKKEWDGMIMLKDNLFLHPCTVNGPDELIDVAHDHNLNKGFLPPRPALMPRELSDLENPRPGTHFCFCFCSVLSIYICCCCCCPSMK